jgi:prepilin-type N-terminal cleavage/methylation domain-containing protein
MIPKTMKPFQYPPSLRERARGDAARGFTLVELIAVMALLVTVIALASPSLSGFFRGRALDAEARRLLSLTRLGQSRAASEGAPMILWVDTAQRAYGLEEDSSYTDQDAVAVAYTLDKDVSVDTSNADLLRDALTRNEPAGNVAASSKHAALPRIRFEPDGGIDEGSLETIRLAGREGASLQIGLSRSRMNYEIQTENNEGGARWR